MKKPDSQDDGSAWNWEGVEKPAIQELQRQGEAYVASQLTASIAADQRATTMAAVFAAMSAGAAAAGATLATNSAYTHAELAGFTATTLATFIASLICAFGARPVGYYNPGFQPQRLVTSARDELQMLRYLVEFLESHIAENGRVQRTAARFMLAGYLFGVCSIPAGIATWALFETGLMEINRLIALAQALPT